MTQLRMRIFAGPNGSGKSTVIKAVRETKVAGRNIDFGYYINADDIAVALSNKKKFSFSAFDIKVNNKEFYEIVHASGLIADSVNEQLFRNAYNIKNNSIFITDLKFHEQLAQIIADFLRKKLLRERKRFSFETVFSHKSKLEIIQNAIDVGYKVYFYFVSTEDPEINKFRVLSRVQKGGHNVPEDKIVNRYKRSLELMYEAAQLSYQSFFFDNSKMDTNPNLFAHFKIINGVKEWDEIKESNVPLWFKNYYSAQIK